MGECSVIRLFVFPSNLWMEVEVQGFKFLRPGALPEPPSGLLLWVPPSLSLMIIKPFYFSYIAELILKAFDVNNPKSKTA